MERVLNFFIVVVKDSLEYVHTSIMREKERKRTPNSSRLRGVESVEGTLFCRKRNVLMG